MTTRPPKRLCARSTVASPISIPPTITARITSASSASAKYSKGRRQGIFLATKLSNRDGDQSRRIVEESLKALQVDQVDLIHIHAPKSMDDLARSKPRAACWNSCRRSNPRS